MKIFVKKYLKRILVVVICVVVAIGSLFFLRSRAGGAVSVVPVSGLGLSEDPVQYSGTVNTGASQDVKLRDAFVKSVNVESGDTVKKGDVLMVYDTESYALTVQSDEAKIAVLEADIAKEQKNLAKYQALKPSEDAPAGYDGGGDDSDSFSGGDDSDSSQDNGTGSQGITPLETKATLSEDMAGTSDTFYVTPDTVVTAGFLQKLRDSGEAANLAVFSDDTYYGTWVIDGSGLPQADGNSEGTYRQVTEDEQGSLAEKIAGSIFGLLPSSGSGSGSSGSTDSGTDGSGAGDGTGSDAGGGSTGSDGTSSTGSSISQDTLRQQVLQALQGSGTYYVQDGSSEGQDPISSDWTLSDSMEITDEGALIKAGTGYGSFQASAPVSYEEYVQGQSGSTDDSNDTGSSDDTEDISDAQEIYESAAESTTSGSDENYAYTKAELADRIKQSQQTLKEKDLELRQEKVTLEQDKLVAKTGEITAREDGVVTYVKDYQTAEVGDTIIKVKGSTQYEVTSYVDELSLAKLSVGDSVTVTDYSSGMSVSGDVTAISEKPASDSENLQAYGVNPNSSYYPVTIRTQEGEGQMQVGDGCQVVFDSLQTKAIVLDLMYVRSDDGGKYVMIQGDNGKLQKKYVKTGKTVYGYEIEILDGLSDDDYIAVPYGKNVKEGARTVREDDSDLYGGMY